MKTIPDAPTQIHAFEYRHEGATWIVKIKATSMEDAWQRICRMQEGTYLGVVHLSIPVKTGIMARSACWIANAFGKRA